MTQPRRALAVLAAAILCALIPGGPRGEEDSPYFPADRIRPGMTGVGRTVFQGHVPEEFEVEFLGVLKNAIGPGQDMILSRLHGKNVERTGVIAGMSGSPVTLDGKLVGAIAYSLGSFGKEAIAGITPISDLLKVAVGEEVSSGAAAEKLLSEWSNPPPDAGSGRPAGLPGSAGEMLPIATPLVFSGFPDALVREVGSLFRARHLEPMQGGSTGSAGADYPIEPGVPIAVTLISGDMSLAATGTLTHVEGNRIWALGHPFLDTGAVRLPMHRAEVVVTYPSAMGSFKISNATGPMGTLLQDRITGVHGELGPIPPMLPVTVTHTSPAGERRLSYQVVHDPVLTPLLLGMTTQASLQRILEYSAPATFRTEMRVETDGHPPVVYALVQNDPGGLQSPAAAEAARDMAAVFHALYSNRFEEPQVRSVQMRVDSIPETRLARIEEVSVTPATVRAGEELTVRASVQPYRGEAFIREFRVKVPPDTPAGPLVITVASARSLDRVERNLLQRQFVGAAGVDEVIRFINTLRSDDTLYVQVARKSLGALVQGEALPLLPLSVIFTLGSSRYTVDEYAAPNLPVVELSQKTDFVLIGGRRMAIKVR